VWKVRNTLLLIIGIIIIGCSMFVTSSFIQVPSLNITEQVEYYFNYELGGFNDHHTGTSSASFGVGSKIYNVGGLNAHERYQGHIDYCDVENGECYTHGTVRIDSNYFNINAGLGAYFKNGTNQYVLMSMGLGNNTAGKIFDLDANITYKDYNLTYPQENGDFCQFTDNNNIPDDTLYYLQGPTIDANSFIRLNMTNMSIVPLTDVPVDAGKRASITCYSPTKQIFLALNKSKSVYVFNATGLGSGSWGTLNDFPMDMNSTEIDHLNDFLIAYSTLGTVEGNVTYYFNLTDSGYGDGTGWHDTLVGTLYNESLDGESNPIGFVNGEKQGGQRVKLIDCSEFIMNMMTSSSNGGRSHSIWSIAFNTTFALDNISPLSLSNTTDEVPPLIGDAFNFYVETNDTDYDSLISANFTLTPPNQTVIYTLKNGTYAVLDGDWWLNWTIPITPSDGGLWKIDYTLLDNNTNTKSYEYLFNITDNNAPTPNITYPANNTEYLESTLDFNFTKIDDYTSHDDLNCWYNNDSNPINITLANCLNTSFSWTLSEHNMTIYMNDSYGNIGSSYSTFNVTTDTSNPSITITQPTGTKTSLTTTATFSITDNVGLDYCFYNVTRGASLEIADDVIPCTTTSKSLILSGDANYVLNIWANDTSGNSNLVSSSFTIDTSGDGNGDDGGGGGGGGGGITETLALTLSDYTISDFALVAPWKKFPIIRTYTIIGNQDFTQCEIESERYTCSIIDNEIKIEASILKPKATQFSDYYSGTLKLKSAFGETKEVPISTRVINLGWGIPLSKTASLSWYLIGIVILILVGVLVWLKKKR